MALSVAAKALALVLFLAAIAGATYGVNVALGIEVEAHAVGISPVHLERQATPGHTVSYLVEVENRGPTNRTLQVEVAGAASGRSAPIAVAEGSSLAVFVPVEVPATIAAGDHALAVRVLEGDKVLRAREGALTLVVLPPAPGIEVGDRAQIRYVGRIAETGRTFATNDPLLVGASLPRTDEYEFRDALLPLSTEPRNVVLGIYENVLGMQPGETRTFTFGEEKGYGPASQTDVIPRRETIDQALTVPNQVQRVTRATFNDHINSTRQGDPATFGVGSTFTAEEEPNVWTYRVTNMTASTVEYKLHVSVGDAFTLYPYWTNASVVRNVSETSIEFFTTPTTPAALEGECPPTRPTPGSGCFTRRPEWPDMSTVETVENGRITIRHDPPAQFRYTTVQGGETQEVVISRLLPDGIEVSVAAQHPLAGKALTFDVTIVSITKGTS